MPHDGTDRSVSGSYSPRQRCAQRLASRDCRLMAHLCARPASARDVLICPAFASARRRRAACADDDEDMRVPLSGATSFLPAFDDRCSNLIGVEIPTLAPILSVFVKARAAV